jgi:hypothetical protein
MIDFLTIQIWLHCDGSIKCYKNLALRSFLEINVVGCSTDLHMRRSTLPNEVSRKPVIAYLASDWRTRLAAQPPGHVLNHSDFN